MKTKEEVRIEGKPVFYAVLYNDFKREALECGYALAMHGSMHSDMDLIAVAWTDETKPVKELVARLNARIGRTVWEEHNLKRGSKKPHGRICYTLAIMGDWYIDLSIIPPKRKKSHETNREKQ
jgi:hypothetical protein